MRKFESGKTLELQQHQNNQLKLKADEIESELISLFPEKIFICEDSNGIKLWENLLFEKLSLSKNKFKVISSNGCTNNEVETAVLHLIRTKPEYKPTIFRQLDRDGFTNEQVAFLESAKQSNKDYSKFNKYKVHFLPVNEIENFAILTDSFFTAKKLEAYKINNKISDAFKATTTNNIFNAIKLCKNDNERNLFRNKEKIMIDEARKNPLILFPGKEIKKTKRQFSVENALKALDFNNLPTELQNYLNTIKDFFDEV